MPDPPSPTRRARMKRASRCPELLIAMAHSAGHSGVVTAALLQMTSAQATIWNRTQMHSGVRSATELLQQEIGQAGRITLPAAVTLSANAAASATTATVSSVSGMFVGERLIVDTGSNQETVTVSAINTSTRWSRSATASTRTRRNSADFVSVRPCVRSARVGDGRDSPTGVVPPAASPVNFTNGSTGIGAEALRRYQRRRHDGVRRVHLRYDERQPLSEHDVVRRRRAKPALTAAQVLLDEHHGEPGRHRLLSVPDGRVEHATCSTWRSRSRSTPHQIDPVTKQLQTETKALLNVSPRNVVNTWELAAINAARVQPTPPSITTLIGLS